MLRRPIVVAAAILLATSFVVAQRASAPSAGRIVLSQLANGASVIFAKSSAGEWGLEISGAQAPMTGQPKPAQIEVYRGDDNVRQLAAGYNVVEKSAGAVVAKATLAGEGGTTFTVEDRWTVSGAVLSVARTVTVGGTDAKAGFFSAVRLVTAPAAKWTDADFLAPGLLYGKPATSATAPGGSAFYEAKRFSIREDYLAAPLFGLSLPDGNWAAVLDPHPRGDTTMTETTAAATTPIIDEQIQFGAVGARQASSGGVEIGFWLPGTTDEFTRGAFGGGPPAPGTAATPTPVVRRRYHPVKAGFAQRYDVSFRFGKSASFRDMEREAWRWAWQVLAPKATPVDVEVTRRALADHLADRVVTAGDVAGIPFVIDAVSGRPGSYRPKVMAGMFRPPSAAAGAAGRSGPSDEIKQLVEWAKAHGIDMDPAAAELELWPKIVLGFCGKNVEVADQLLIEGDRDSGPRGQRLRATGLKIMESIVRVVPMNPPAGEGFDIRTGKASGVRGEPSLSQRSVSEDTRIAVDMYRREKTRGRQHPEWLAWARDYAAFLVSQQRADGSLPANWAGGTGAVKGESGATSYAAVPVLVRIAEETGDKRYADAAVKVGNYVWTNFGSKNVYLGATGGDIADKESGMLSLEAFLALYEHTKDVTWLDRAKAAASYTESWIWIWNVPMPIGANPAELGWKPGVPTIGVNSIGSNVAGHVDQYLDWAVPSFARLSRYTKDPHYLDVARILLHGTKAMLALPGRTYDLLGPGWQQEHWRMGPGVRGVGAHRTWLPWISVNHLHGITGLEDFDKALYRQLAEGK
jgi:hypothetical protein